jgi:hypothetical protein
MSSAGPPRSNSEQPPVTDRNLTCVQQGTWNELYGNCNQRRSEHRGPGLTENGMSEQGNEP